jgi:hypothetical protein
MAGCWRAHNEAIWKAQFQFMATHDVAVIDNMENGSLWLDYSVPSLDGHIVIVRYYAGPADAYRCVF